MEQLLQTIEWAEVIPALLSIIWTSILVPIGKQIYDELKARKLDNYATIFYDEIVKAVKSVYETTVKDIKGDPELWTDEKMEEVKEIAKNKAIQALSSIAYKTLKEANSDFEEYLDSLIGTALYDVKNGLK